MGAVVGKWSFELPLSDLDVRNICREVLDSVSLSGKRMLVLIPDHTRHA